MQAAASIALSPRPRLSPLPSPQSATHPLTPSQFRSNLLHKHQPTHPNSHNMTNQILQSLIDKCRGQVCQACFWTFEDPDDLVVDDIIPISDYDGDDPLQNLTLLCQKCSELKSDHMTLFQLQDELRFDHEAMPQSPTLDNTVYLHAGQEFEAPIRPTKALRNLLDEITQRRPNPNARNPWTSITKRRCSTGATHPIAIRFQRGVPIKISSWRSIWQILAKWMIQSRQIVRAHSPVCVDWKRGEMEVIYLDHRRRDTDHFEYRFHFEGVNYLIRKGDTVAAMKWTYRLLERYRVHPDDVQLRFDDPSPPYP